MSERRVLVTLDEAEPRTMEEYDPSFFGLACAGFALD
jgi:hypothetical protein